MATRAGSIFDATEALGLVDPRVLKQLRRQSLERSAIMRQNKLSGTDYANAEVGALLGRGLRAAFGKAGILKDEEMERAEQVESARNRAKTYVTSLPEEIRSQDPLEASVQERQALLDELVAAGLHQEADTVRGQILDLRKQGLEFRKLAVDTANSEAQLQGRQLDNAYEEETFGDRVTQQRADAALSATNAAVAISTEGYRTAMPRVELEAKLEDLMQSKELRPYALATAKANSAVADLQARYGGAPPTLAKLQMRRDHILEYLSKNPQDTFAQQNLKELNAAIQTDAMGIQRSVDNYTPTSAVRTDLQRDLINASQFQEQITGILDTLNTSDMEPFGGIATARRAAAGVVSQSISLVGAPQDVASKVGSFLYSDKEIEVSSQARQLKADIISWLSSGSRSSSTDVETAGNLLQVLDNPEVDSRQAKIALTNFSGWLLSKQSALWKVMESNLQDPSAEAAGGAGDDLDAFLQGSGTYAAP